MPYRRSILLSASEDRLQTLINERLKPGGDKEAVDRRIWDLFGEEWCVLVTDLTGFSRGVAKFGIVHFLQTIYESERMFVPIVERYDGIMLKAEGDSFLIIFRNTHKAIIAAIEMQRAALEYNKARTDEEKVLFGAGLGFGQVLRIGDADVFGEQVNAAYILGEDTASAFEILITEAARDAAGEFKDLRFEEIGDCPPGAVKAYRVRYD
jgi:class 3 adenylate cyclase